MSVFWMNLITVGAEFSTKEQAIRQLTALLHKADAITDEAAFIKDVMNRESTMSTGLGLGLAMPHGKSVAASQLKVAVAVLGTPLEFDSIDGEPVKVIFLTAVPPDANSRYMKILQKVSMLYQTQMDTLANVTNADELFNLLKDINNEI